MIIKPVNLKNQPKGVALVIALILLFMLTILGVASMSGVSMQERMAGNINLQTLAFEAASAGVATSLEFGLDNSNWPEGSTCQKGSGEWQTEWSAPISFENDQIPTGLSMEYRQRVGCFEPNPIPQHWADDPDYRVPTQLLVLNQGVVRRGSETLAMREIEVRVENRGGDTQCAIRIEGTLDTIDIAGGGPAVDGGEGGCPISLSPGGGAEALKAEIGDAHLAEYQPDPPGISESDGHAPWNDAVSLAEVTDDLKTAVLGYQDFVETAPSSEEAWRCDLGDRVGVDLEGCPPSTAALPEGLEKDRLSRILDFVELRNGPWNNGSWTINNCESTFYPGSVRIGNGNIPAGQCDIDWGPTSNGSNNQRYYQTGVTVGTGNPRHITYIAGNLGNPSNNNGSGIVVIEGGNCWSGTADFQGLQLIVGGHYEIIGGGNGDTTGSIIMTKLADRYGATDNRPDFWGDGGTEVLKKPLFDDPEADPPRFENSGLVFRGGGNHTVEFSCGGVAGQPAGHTEYIDQINLCLETSIEPNCDPEGGTRMAIASWREYIDRQRWAPTNQ